MSDLTPLQRLAALPESEATIQAQQLSPDERRQFIMEARTSMDNLSDFMLRLAVTVLRTDRERPRKGTAAEKKKPAAPELTVADL